MTTSAVSLAFAGAISSNYFQGQGSLKVFDSIFKKNRAIQVNPSVEGVSGGGAVNVYDQSGQNKNGILILGSVFELNEASNQGGAALVELDSPIGALGVDWINNKELLFGNDAGTCDGVFLQGSGCFNVGDNFSEVVS